MSYYSESALLDFKIELSADLIYKKFGKNQKQNIRLMNSFVKCYLKSMFKNDSAYRLNAAMNYESNITVHSSSYDNIRKIHNAFSDNDLLSFEISENTYEIMEWVKARKITTYSIDSIYSKDLSIIFENESDAMEFKLKFGGSDAS